MWISKNKYENMKANITECKNRIKNLVEIVGKQERCINKLMSIHDLEINEYYSMDWGSFYRFNKDVHPKPTTTVGDVDQLTFKELAEYVINGKPITRVREHEVVVCPKTECEEDTNNDGNN